MVCERIHPTHSPRSGRPGAIALIGCLAGATWLATRLVRRLEVVGQSMLPAFEPGDRLVAVKLPRVRPGDVVAVADPRDSGRLLVKRVRGISAGELELRGDNDSASTDSRMFGPVPRSAVAGTVVYRYGPPGRSRRRPW